MKVTKRCFACGVNETIDVELNDDQLQVAFEAAMEALDTACIGACIIFEEESLKARFIRADGGIVVSVEKARKETNREAN